MKKMLFLCLLLCTRAAVAQTSPTPFKGANTLLVVLPDSGMAAWKKAAAAFVGRGFAIKSSDKDLLTLASEPKGIKQGPRVTASANVDGRKVYIYGTFSSSVVENQQITFRGMQGSPFMLTWNELVSIANALGGTVTYNKR